MVSTILASAILIAESAVPTDYAEDGTPIGSPGFLGFLVTMVLGIGIILLMLDMYRRARRMRYRNEYAMAREAELRAAESEQQETASSPTNDGVPAPASAEEGLAEHIRRAH